MGHWMRVRNRSMEPTLSHNDIIFAKKWESDDTLIRDAIVVLRLSDKFGGLSVKRVVALPGDHVNVESGTVRINGQPLGDKYLSGLPKTRGLERLDCIVPVSHIFVLGDYRNYHHTIDSRKYGPIAFSKISGIVILRLWPFKIWRKHR